MLVGLALAENANAYLIDKQVTIQPIVMRSTDGSAAANPQRQIFEAETDKIWAQAGVDFQFLPAIYYDNSLYTNVSTDIFQPNSVYSLALDPGHQQSSNPQVINLWFVRSIDGGASASGYSLQSTENYYGFLIERNGVSIADSAFAYGSGAGMRDIFAYEVARNLGLDNGTLGAPGDPNNLMKPSGPYPTSITNIYPDGTAFGHLTTSQIAMARRFSFAADLPSAQRYTYPVLETNAPQLKIAISASQVTVSWPDPSTGYVLEETAINPSQSVPNNWQDVVETVALTNGQKQVVLPLSSGARLFRLHKP